MDADYLWEIFWFKNQCRHVVGKYRTYMEAAAIYSKLPSLEAALLRVGYTCL